MRMFVEKDTMVRKEDRMLNHTMDQIAGLKLQGLQTALLEQMDQPGNYSTLSFEERLAHLIDREVTERKTGRLKDCLGYQD